MLHRVATSSCRGHVDKSTTEPFLLLHREHGTGYRRSWNCCDRRTCFVAIWNIFVSFCLRAPRYRLTLWCALGLLVGGAIQVPQSTSYSYNGSTTWNSLPPLVRASELSQNAFTREVTTHLFSTARHRWNVSTRFRRRINMHWLTDWLTYLLTYLLWWWIHK